MTTDVPDQEIVDLIVYVSAQKVLEELVVNNPDLEKLEALLDQFNVFEVMGVVRQELRHSDFLTFLLDPQQQHGLKDAFLKRLLQKVLFSANNILAPITLIDLDVWSLDQILILREWRNIDILLIDESHQLVIIIENKIDTSEHSDQLRRYYQIVQQHYPGKAIIGLYLTRDGEQPSHDAYFPVDYGQVCNLLGGIVESRASTLGADVLTVIHHYIQMLRRHIVSDSEIAELCQRIYRKHRRALDLIYEYRPDQQAMISTFLREELIKPTSGFVLDHSTKSVVRFTIQEWDVPVLREGKGWTPSGRILIFEFKNEVNSLNLCLTLGPGPQGIRQRLFDMALKQSPFKPARKTLNKLWNFIYQRSFLRAESYEEASDEEIKAEIGKHWDAFLQNDLPMLNAALKAQQWIWQTTDSVAPTNEV